MTIGLRNCKVNATLDTCLVFCGSRGPAIAELETENGVRHELFPRAKVNCSTCEGKVSVNRNLTGSDKKLLMTRYLYPLQAAYNFLTAFLAEAYRPLWPGSWDVTHSQAEALISSSSECEVKKVDLCTYFV